jgi:hypothetical protein
LMLANEVPNAVFKEYYLVVFPAIYVYYKLTSSNINALTVNRTTYSYF